MKFSKLFVVLMVLFFAGFFAGCNGGSNGSDTNSDKGTLSLSLTDASTDAYKAVYVTIDEVQAHLEGTGDNWTTVAEPHQTYKLLELTNGIMENLGITDLEPGTYTQLRLLLGDTADNSTNILGNTHPSPNYVIDSEDNVHDLKVPSGYQTGIKLVHEFDIVSGLTVDLVLDFDANRSVVKAGNSGQYLLKPTIKVVNTVNNAILSGTVTDEQQTGLAGVLVSAQIYDSNATDEKDKVQVYTSTLTDDTGNYSMYLEPGTYNIVASASDRSPDCVGETVVLNDLVTQDFSLAAAETGTVQGTVTIPDADENSSATLSFRKSGQCDDGLQEIEVYSENVTPGDYSVTLPTGDYHLVASSDGQTTQTSDLTVTNAGTVTVNIAFP